VSEYPRVSRPKRPKCRCTWALVQHKHDLTVARVVGRVRSAKSAGVKCGWWFPAPVNPASVANSSPSSTCSTPPTRLTMQRRVGTSTTPTTNDATHASVCGMLHLSTAGSSVRRSPAWISSWTCAFPSEPKQKPVPVPVPVPVSRPDYGDVRAVLVRSPNRIAEAELEVENGTPRARACAHAHVNAHNRWTHPTHTINLFCCCCCCCCRCCCWSGPLLFRPYLHQQPQRCQVDPASACT